MFFFFVNFGAASATQLASVALVPLRGPTYFCVPSLPGAPLQQLLTDGSIARPPAPSHQPLPPHIRSGLLPCHPRKPVSGPLIVGQGDRGLRNSPRTATLQLRSRANSLSPLGARRNHGTHTAPSQGPFRYVVPPPIIVVPWLHATPRPRSLAPGWYYCCCSGARPRSEVDPLFICCLSSWFSSRPCRCFLISPYPSFRCPSPAVFGSFSVDLGRLFDAVFSVITSRSLWRTKY